MTPKPPLTRKQIEALRLVNLAFPTNKSPRSSRLAWDNEMVPPSDFQQIAVRSRTRRCSEGAPPEHYLTGYSRPGVHGNCCQVPQNLSFDR
jgi:hypothetical protein